MSWFSYLHGIQHWNSYKTSYDQQQHFMPTNTPHITTAHTTPRNPQSPLQQPLLPYLLMSRVVPNDSPRLDVPQATRVVRRAYVTPLARPHMTPGCDCRTKSSSPTRSSMLLTLLLSYLVTDQSRYRLQRLQIPQLDAPVRRGCRQDSREDFATSSTCCCRKRCMRECSRRVRETSSEAG